MMRIPFNKPHLVGSELKHLGRAQKSRRLAGDGPFTRRCQSWLEKNLGSPSVFLTHSGTGALEMAALLAEVGPGDEVILPSFTFPSTANAFALRGAKLVFVDIRPDTLNIDERLIEKAVTKRTKAVACVHYAGVACEMDRIMALAKSRRLVVIEDAAHGLMGEYKGRPLGGLGHMAAISFHETKNIVCGEGGALALNDRRYAARAEILWQKGTNRNAFLRGQVDKYTWVDIGSSFVPSELTAAFLWAQLGKARDITRRRMAVWRRYHELCAGLEERGSLLRPAAPASCRHNAHTYYVLLPDQARRDRALRALAAAGVGAAFHYIPLHSSPAGRKYGRPAGSMEVTDSVSSRILRLPLWADLPPAAAAAAVRVLESAA